MGAVTTLVLTVAATAGAVALYRFVDRQAKDLRDAIRDVQREQGKSGVIDYERDPESGVYKPKH